MVRRIAHTHMVVGRRGTDISKLASWAEWDERIGAYGESKDILLEIQDGASCREQIAPDILPSGAS